MPISICFYEVLPINYFYIRLVFNEEVIICFSVQAIRDLKKLSKLFNANVHRVGFERFLEDQTLNPKRFKAPDEDDRIYPNSYAPLVLKNSKGERIITPMKYQLLPNFSNEDKYTIINSVTGRKKQVMTYNARLDSLNKRQAWQATFMKKHALLAISQFYEWTSLANKRELISFKHTRNDIIAVPCLWDHWVSGDGKQEISSFAIITTSAPNEVLKVGPTRSPVFLNEKDYDVWLSPESHSEEDIYKILNKTSNSSGELFQCHSKMS